MSKTSVRYAVGHLTVLIAATILGFVGAVHAVANSQVTKDPLMESGDDDHDWAAPAGGSIQGYSGDMYVTDSGSFFDGEDNEYDESITTWADGPYHGVITGADEGVWELSVNYPGYIKAHTNYVPTGWFPSKEPFRAETTLTLELRGSFGNHGFERQVVVDSYTTPGLTEYDPVGGGSSPSTYSEQGLSSVFAAINGPKVNHADVNWDPTPIRVTGLGMNFNLYARGKQRIKSDKEEDVSLYTLITATDDDGNTGWNGWVKSYELLGDGTEKFIKVHPIG